MENSFRGGLKIISQMQICLTFLRDTIDAQSIKKWNSCKILIEIGIDGWILHTCRPFKINEFARQSKPPYKGGSNTMALPREHYSSLANLLKMQMHGDVITIAAPFQITLQAIRNVVFCNGNITCSQQALFH